MEIEIFHYLFLSSIIFILGICGISMNRKNLIIILMSIELILLAININFVAFSVYLKDLVGQIYSIFILTIAASEAAIGLAIIVTFYRNKSSIEIKDINNLGG